MYVWNLNYKGEGPAVLFPAGCRICLVELGASRRRGTDYLLWLGCLLTTPPPTTCCALPNLNFRANRLASAPIAPAHNTTSGQALSAPERGCESRELGGVFERAFQERRRCTLGVSESRKDRKHGDEELWKYDADGPWVGLCVWGGRYEG